MQKRKTPIRLRGESRSLSEAIRFISKITILGSAFLGGYEYRRLQQLNNSHTLADITVINRRDAFSYRMITSLGQAFEVTFCRDSPTDFIPGVRLKVLNYEQRVGCKSLKGQNLGFIAYTDSNGDRILHQGDSNER